MASQGARKIIFAGFFLFYNSVLLSKRIRNIVLKSMPSCESTRLPEKTLLLPVIAQSLSDHPSNSPLARGVKNYSLISCTPSKYV